MTVTIGLIILNCIVSFLCFSNEALFNKLAHIPYIEARSNEYSRFITSGFVHGSYLHLGLNMYVFFNFGPLVEHEFKMMLGEYSGAAVYFFMYIAAIVVSDVPSYRKNKNNSNYIAIGASGAVAAVLFSFILFEPWATLRVMFAIDLPAIVVAVLYVVYEQWASNNSNDGIGHDAHVTGALFGFLFTLILQPSLISNILHR